MTYAELTVIRNGRECRIDVLGHVTPSGRGAVLVEDIQSPQTKLTFMERDAAEDAVARAWLDRERDPIDPED